MTENEWLDCEDPSVLLTFLAARFSDRKYRLLECACLRRINSSFRTRHFRVAVLTLERHADGFCSHEEFQRACKVLGFALASPDRRPSNKGEAFRHVLQDAGDWGKRATVMLSSVASTTVRLEEQAEGIEQAVAHAKEEGRLPADFDLTRWEPFVDEQLHRTVTAVLNEAYATLVRGERVEQVMILRDVFGNPFRSVEFSPSWLTSTVVAVARQMYESRGFSAMPILADALQDAGCENEDILSHCRQPNEHVRGCWVVDMVLGKR